MRPSIAGATVGSMPSQPAEIARHWDGAYADGDDSCSWTQRRPQRSLAAIAQISPDRDAPIVDVGGGASPLAAALVSDGYRDVTVLDLSAAALQLARSRMGADVHLARWMVADVLAWAPPRAYAVWHDRAVLHFFTADEDRARYARTLRAALHPGGHAVIACFAPGGPERCSGLPVRQSSAAELLGLLGPGFEEVSSAIETHVTPGGAEQAFTWLVARRGARG